MNKKAIALGETHEFQEIVRSFAMLNPSDQCGVNLSRFIHDKMTGIRGLVEEAHLFENEGVYFVCPVERVVVPTQPFPVTKLHTDKCVQVYVYGEKEVVVPEFISGEYMAFLETDPSGLHVGFCEIFEGKECTCPEEE